MLTFTDLALILSELDKYIPLHECFCFDYDSTWDRFSFIDDESLPFIDQGSFRRLDQSFEICRLTVPFGQIVHGRHHTRIVSADAWLWREDSEHLFCLTVIDMSRVRVAVSHQMSVIFLADFLRLPWESLARKVKSTLDMYRHSIHMYDIVEARILQVWPMIYLTKKAIFHLISLSLFLRLSIHYWIFEYGTAPDVIARRIRDRVWRRLTRVCDTPPHVHTIFGKLV